MNMISINTVTKRYGKNNVVDGLSLDIQKGQLITLIGPSGCGKTTTLKMINRLIEPDKGKILVNGRNILDYNPVELRRGIGYVIQQISLFPNMTIGKNISLVCKLLGWDKEKSKNRAKELLELVNMDPDTYFNRYPNELSGGQQQRIGVIRALAAEPDIILMDEPFGALDPITKNQLQNELLNIQAKLHKTIVFVTHDMDEAVKLADTIVLMKEGKIIQMGEPDDLLLNPKNDFVESFFGSVSNRNTHNSILVSDIMIESPVTISYKRGLAESIRKMKVNHVDSLIVLDDDKHYLGVVSLTDLFEHGNRQIMIGNLIKKDIQTISADDTAYNAANIMKSNNSGYLPVLDNQTNLLGLVTRSSLVNMLTDVIWSEPETDELND